MSERTKLSSPITDKFSTLHLAEQLTFIHHTLLSTIPARYVMLCASLAFWAHIVLGIFSNEVLTTSVCSFQAMMVVIFYQAVIVINNEA